MSSEVQDKYMDAYLDFGARVHGRKSALHLADDPARMLSQLHHTGELYNTKTPCQLEGFY